MTTSQSFLAIHELLLKTDAAYWASYWHTASDKPLYYPQYIATLVNTIHTVRAKRLFIISQDRAHFLAALLATLHAGIPAVLPPVATAAALQELLEDDDALATDQIELAAVTSRYIFLDAHVAPNSQSSQRFLPIDPKQAKVVFYTSGSTGMPKPVEKSLAQLEAEIITLENSWGCLEKNITFLSTVAHHHIYGLLFSLLWPVCAGYRIARTTFLLWPDVMNHSADKRYYLISSPAHLGRFPQIKTSHTFARVFSSGGALPYHAAQSSLTFLNVLPTEIYGSTETGGVAYRQQKTRTEPWTRFNNILLREGAQQQLCIQSPYLPTNDWYQTTDQVTLLDADQFHLLGRTDRIVKVEGKRVALSALEQKLMTLDTIAEAVILLLTNTTRDELAAIVVLSSSGQQQLTQLGKISFVRQLRHRLAEHFDRVAIPRKWRFVTEIPRNAQGKKVEAELRELFKSN